MVRNADVSNYYGVWEALFNGHNEDEYWTGHTRSVTHGSIGTTGGGVTPDNKLKK